MRVNPVDYNAWTEEELLSMKKREACEGLSEQQKNFCEYYIEGHNKRMALIKAGYNQRSESYVLRLLHNENIQRYICWLKARVLKQHFINASDILDAWIRIAFSDMSDFVDIYPYSIRLKPADQIDGQLIKSIKSSKDGISIELYDKMKALDNLSKYIEDMPSDFKQKLEERKVQLLEEELELKKKAQQAEIPEVEDDGFMQAIKESITAIWDMNDTESDETSENKA